MITKEQLNEDQQKSFRQMTNEVKLSEKKTLELIDEFCIQKKMTGLRVSGRFVLTPEGRRAARVLAEVN